MSLSAYTIQCHIPGCQHPICESCGKAMRKNPDRIADHQGTVQQATKTSCYGCYKKTYVPPSQRVPDTLTGHILSRMSRTHRPSYEYILDRRLRGIPSAGHRTHMKEPIA